MITPNRILIDKVPRRDNRLTFIVADFRKCDNFMRWKSRLALYTRVGTLIEATIYLQLIQN